MKKIVEILEKIELWLQKISKHKVLWAVCFFMIAAGITVARRPDALLNPQFWAEDGVFWYQEAYNATNPLTPFLMPKQKYFQTISRVGAAISMMFNISYAPLIFNLIAIAIQALPACFFVSKRFEVLVPKLSHRVFLSLLYLMLPGTFETHANLTNAQWRLAILMILIIIAPASKKIFWRIFDNLLLIIAGLSGPFVFFGFPITLGYLYFKYSRDKMVSFGLLGITFLIQLYSFLFMVDPGALRSSAPLGASVINFFKIIAGNVFIRGLLGVDLLQKITDLGVWRSGYAPVVFGLFSLTLVGYAFWKSKIELKLFIAFSFMVLVGGMISPQVSLVKPQWEAMATVPGGRYYILPILAWVTVLAYLFISEKRKLPRYLFGVLLSFVLLVGMPSDFKVKPFRNFHFQNQVREFNALKAGESYTFKFNPSSKWKITLIKK